MNFHIFQVRILGTDLLNSKNYYQKQAENKLLISELNFSEQEPTSHETRPDSLTAGPQLRTGWAATQAVWPAVPTA